MKTAVEIQSYSAVRSRNVLIFGLKGTEEEKMCYKVDVIKLT